MIRPALTLFVLMTVVTGVVYPLAVAGVAQVVFPAQANGSLITKNGQIVGSRLIGQHFEGPRYFWSRPSATGPQPDNGLGSSGSNLGPLNPALQDAVKARIAALKAAQPGQSGAVPADLVTASASGLDPHISVAAARYQAHRVAAARGLPVEEVEALIVRYSSGAQFGVFGDSVVDVLGVNLALDGR